MYTFFSVFFPSSLFGDYRLMCNVHFLSVFSFFQWSLSGDQRLVGNMNFLIAFLHLIR